MTKTLSTSSYAVLGLIVLALAAACAQEPVPAATSGALVQLAKDPNFKLPKPPTKKSSREEPDDQEEGFFLETDNAGFMLASPGEPAGGQVGSTSYPGTSGSPTEPVPAAAQPTTTSPQATPAAGLPSGTINADGGGTWRPLTSGATGTLTHQYYGVDGQPTNYVGGGNLAKNDWNMGTMTNGTINTRQLAMVYDPTTKAWSGDYKDGTGAVYTPNGKGGTWAGFVSSPANTDATRGTAPTNYTFGQQTVAAQNVRLFTPGVMDPRAVADGTKFTPFVKAAGVSNIYGGFQPVKGFDIPIKATAGQSIDFSTAFATLLKR